MILYLIGNFRGSNTGRGGHYYSLSTLSSAMQETCDNAVVSLGHEAPPALRDLVNFVHVDASLFLEELALTRLAAILSDKGWDKKISVVHAYDSSVAYVGALIARKLGVRFFLTKCGGAKPGFFYPRPRNIVVFHEADRQHFLGDREKHRNVLLIPNRVSPVAYDRRRAENLFPPKSQFTFIRVGRIGPDYERIATQAIRLVAELNVAGFECQLYIVGYVQDAATLSRLRGLATDKVKFFTTSDYTHKSAELLGYADAIIGTGRGAMEGMSLARLVLMPNRLSELPCVLTPHTARFGMEENFSERVQIPEEENQYPGIAQLAALLANQARVAELQAYAQQLFTDHYDVDAGVRTLTKSYQSPRSLGFESFSSLAKLRGYHLMVGIYNISVRSLMRRLRGAP